MKAKVIISPVGSNDQMLPGIYHTKDGKVRVLVGDTKYLELTPYDYEKQKPKEISYTFSRRGMPTKDYSYETDEKTMTASDKEVKALVKIFWGEHPQFMINNKTTEFTKSPNFNLIDVVESGILSHKSWSDRLSIINRINSMSHEDRVDVAYFYGVTPTLLNEKELILKLADFTEGVCVSEVVDGNATRSNKDQFLDTWMKETDVERTYIVNTRKAIALGIFANNSENGRDSYYYGQTFVGSVFNDVLAFCKRETRIYSDSIVREISDRESKSQKNSSQKIGATKVTEEDKAELMALKEEVAQLIKEGFAAPQKGIQNFGIDKLKPIAEEGRKKKELSGAGQPA